MNFTSEQIQAIRQGEPVRVVLPEIGEECVVVRAADFEIVARSLEDWTRGRHTRRSMRHGRTTGNRLEWRITTITRSSRNCVNQPR